MRRIEEGGKILPRETLLEVIRFFNVLLKDILKMYCEARQPVQYAVDQIVPENLTIK